MPISRQFRLAVFALLAVVGLYSQAVRAGDPDTYAAIAYSEAGFCTGTSTGFFTQSDAEQAAMTACLQNSRCGRDVRVMVVARNGFCALAFSTDRFYGWAKGTDYDYVKGNATSQCRQRSGQKIAVVIVGSND